MLRNRYNNGILVKQTIAHFCVDAACAASVVATTLTTPAAMVFFIAYNVIAFCLQPLFGLLMDRRQIQPRLLIRWGIVWVLFGLLGSLNRWGVVGCVGLGNCLFHVGAGSLILRQAQGKMAPLGVFVSSGAVGLTLGSLGAVNEVFRMGLGIALMILIWISGDSQALQPVRKKSAPLGIIALLAMCVALRAFMGFMPVTRFIQTPTVLILISLAVCLGKSSGGFLCDRWGIRWVILLSTGVVIPLFLVSFDCPFLWSAVQVVVNLSMPVTLYLLYRCLPLLPGFAFGLAAACLMIGLGGALILPLAQIPPPCFLLLFVLNSGMVLLAERKLR